ncbi:hypothetical protein TNCV_3800461 [Trichonephila clavipes]|nr:hypothetical protein TNCV_3800461 [Trichonephila clavipes]
MGVVIYKQKFSTHAAPKQTYMLLQNDILIDVACHRYTLNKQVSSGPRIIPPQTRAILHHRNGVVQWCSLGGEASPKNTSGKVLSIRERESSCASAQKSRISRLERSTTESKGFARTFSKVPCMTGWSFNLSVELQFRNCGNLRKCEIPSWTNTLHSSLAKKSALIFFFKMYLMFYRPQRGMKRFTSTKLADMHLIKDLLKEVREQQKDCTAKETHKEIRWTSGCLNVCEYASPRGNTHSEGEARMSQTSSMALL